MQVFDVNGNFLTKFGEEGSRNQQFKFPRALSINCNGEIIVADSHNKLIKIFSLGSIYENLVEQILLRIPITVSNTVNIL